MTARATLVAGVVVAALVGYALVQLVLGQQSPTTTRTAGATAGTGRERTAATPPGLASAGPTRVVNGIGEGFAHTPLGAVAAARNYLQTLQQSLVTGSARWGEVVRVLTAPPLTARALQVQAAVVATARRLSGPRAATFVRGWPLGYRVDAYRPARARVQVWTLGVVAGRGGVVAPDYSTTVCDMRWLGGDWKLTAARSVPGPTPPADGSDPTAVSGFVAAAGKFGAFASAP